VRGLLAHLDVAALDAAAAASSQDDDSCEAAAAAVSALAHPWMLLSVLLLQLATAAAADSSDTTPAAVNGTQTGGSSAAAAAGSEAAACSPQQLWQSLQTCFEERQAWWGAAGIADPGELLPLLTCKQQLDLLLIQQVEEQMALLQQQDSLEGLQQQQQQQQQPWQQQQQDASPDRELQQQPWAILGLPPLSAADTASQQQELQTQQHSRDERSRPLSPWGQLQQLLCCKAIVLLFVLGPFNAYSWLAMQAVDAVAESQAASVAVEGLGQLVLPHMRGLLMQPSLSMDSVEVTAIAAR
jgi:hypothetical protein